MTRRLDNSVLSELGKNNSYAVRRKAPTFKGVMSSTVISEGDISPISANLNNTNDSTVKMFKVPRLLPNKFTKKKKITEMALESIAEEKENESPVRSTMSVLETDCTATVTPVRGNSMLRRRTLTMSNFEGEEQVDPQLGVNQSVSVQGKQTGIEFKKTSKTLSRIGNLTGEVDVTSRNVTAPCGKSALFSTNATLSQWDL